MVYVTAVLTWAWNLLGTMLTALQTRPAGALLTTPMIHLYTTSSAPITPHSTPTQFTEATFTGYAAIALPTLIGPINIPGGTGTGMTCSVTFLCTGGSPPGQTIEGYWIDDGATNFYAGEQFPNPIPIVTNGDFLELDLVLPLVNPAIA